MEQINVFDFFSYMSELELLAEEDVFNAQKCNMRRKFFKFCTNFSILN